MSNKGWITTKSTVDYKNPYMQVVKNEVTRPNGYTAPYYVLERPTFAVIIPLTSDGYTYLVEQYRYPISRNSWEFPMGTVEGATHKDAALQELKEETGLRASRWTKIGEYAIAPGHNNQIAHLYLAQDLTQGQAQPEQGELLTLKKFSLGEVAAMIKKAEIIDGPTICAFHLLTLYLKDKPL